MTCKRAECARRPMSVPFSFFVFYAANYSRSSVWTFAASVGRFSEASEDQRDLVASREAFRIHLVPCARAKASPPMSGRHSESP
jgi:hypothetical protein